MSAAPTDRRAPATAQADPPLGEVRFEDWFETPMFESGPDERLEQLVTSRKGPLRAVAATVLRLAALRPPRPAGRGPSPAATAPPVPVEAAGPDPSGSRRRHIPAHSTRRRRAGPAGGGWRSRTGRILDSWAEREARGAERLETLLLPARWRS